jgi:LysM repeat protein
MPPIVRILAGVLVVCAGASLAMLFRSDAPPVTVATTPGLTAPLVEGPKVVAGQSGWGTAPTSVGEYPLSGDSAVRPDGIAPNSDPFRRRDLMPQLPAQSPIGTGPLTARTEPELAEDLDANPRPVPAADGSLRHRVADGDTLAKLAARYLGNPARQLEIYELNRDVLPSPQALPIGTLLRIPRRDDPPRPLYPDRLRPVGE